MNRRDFLNSLFLVALTLPNIKTNIFANNKKNKMIFKTVPKTNNSIPPIGMGTWITFNVGDSIRLRDARTEVLKTFFDMGGRMVDSSPMYGSAQEVMGYALAKLNYPKTLFSATKVWTSSKNDGVKQVNDALQLWGLDSFDLMQVHNLVSWEEHLETMFEMKRNGLIKYVGITTSHGSRHNEMEKIMLSQDIDFAQFTYNVLDREVEDRLLPIAKEKNIATIINRPFQRGSLFRKFERYPLPNFVKEYEINHWSQFFLKFIISHPDVTCVIPATSKVEHMKENMSAMYGKIPNEKRRMDMINYIRSL